jgi:DNA-binding MarR family transcriptional regulator
MSTPLQPIDPDEQLHRYAVTLRRGATSLVRRLRAERPASALPLSQLNVLGHLYERGGPLTPGELAAAEQIAPQSLTRVLAELERAGLVSRERDHDDARRSRIALTELGNETLVADARQRDAWLAAALALECNRAERGVMAIAGRLMERLAWAGTVGRGAEPGTATPILPSHDVALTTAFFTALGFTLCAGSDEGYAMLERGAIELHFTHQPGVDPFSGAGSAYLQVADSGALYREFAAAGAAAPWEPDLSEALLRERWAGERNVARLGAPPENKPWRMREFALFDPSNNLLRIGTPVAPGARSGAR